MSKKTFILNLALVLLCATNGAHATVTAFTDKHAWQAAAGSFATITFTEIPAGTFLDTQYANLGVVFTDGTDLVFLNSMFINDGTGVRSVEDDLISVAFTQPMTAIAVDFPGAVTFRLYNQGQLIYTSGIFGSNGIGWFGGLISTQPFDAAVIIDPFEYVFIDDLFFGPPIPAPGALALLGAAGLLAPRHRRRP